MSDERTETAAETHSKTAEEARVEWDRRTREAMLCQPETHRGWLKVRGVVKQWAPRFCVLRPPVLLLFKDEADVEKQSVTAVVHLRGCVCSPRQSKMEGFCMKIVHSAHHSIFYGKGLRGESLSKGLINADELLLLAADEAAGTEWLHALQDAVAVADAASSSNTASSSTTASDGNAGTADEEAGDETKANPESAGTDDESAHKESCANEGAKTEGDEAKEEEEEESKETAEETTTTTTTTTTGMTRDEELYTLAGVVDGTRLSPPAAQYQHEVPRGEMTFDAFEQGRSVIMSLVRQIRPGMDLSKVVLPTHILEPRSFLEKLTDYFSHIELITEAVHAATPLARMLALSRWYISGFHIMPKTPKKPYNPILGETFRCMWKNDGTRAAGAPPSQSFLLAEQVSHHPPISALYACNRADGWIINGAIVARSKFWGTSVGALLDGTVTLYMPEHGEEYVIGFPSALAKGFIIGPLTMEMYGKVHIRCAQSGLTSTIEFKTKPTFGGEFNRVGGGIHDADGRALYTFSGRYDREVFYHEGHDSAPAHTLWRVDDADPLAGSVPRWTIPPAQQGAFESERLWDKVTRALIAGDQTTATEGKTALEEAQRQAAREREAAGTAWVPRYFVLENGEWRYRWLNPHRLADNEVGEYECDHHIQPIARTAFDDARAAPAAPAAPAPAPDSGSGSGSGHSDDKNGGSTPRASRHGTHSGNSNSPATAKKHSHGSGSGSGASKSKAVRSLQSAVDAHNRAIEALQGRLRTLEAAVAAKSSKVAPPPTPAPGAEPAAEPGALPGVLLLLAVLLLFVHVWRAAALAAAPSAATTPAAVLANATGGTVLLVE